MKVPKPIWVFSTCALIFAAGDVRAESHEIANATEHCIQFSSEAEHIAIPSGWVRVVDHLNESGQGSVETRIYLSPHRPLKITTEVVRLVNGFAAVKRCSVSTVDTSTGTFRYRMRPVEIGDVWENVRPFPNASDEHQLEVLQQAFAADPHFAEDLRDSRTIAHGRNRTFWNCQADYPTTVSLLPDGITEAEHSPWVIDVYYAPIGLSGSEEVLQNCPR